MQIQMNGFHRLLANSRPKVDKSAWQARRQMLSDEISIKRTSPVETTISPEARDMWKKLQEQKAQQEQEVGQEQEPESLQDDDILRMLEFTYSIESNVSKLRHSYETEEHKDSLTRRQAALRELSQMKALQESEERRREQEMQKSSEKSTMHQEEMNRKNAELLMMLESFDKMEEEEKNNKENKDSDDNVQKEEAADKQEQNGIIQNGEWLGISAAKKEMHFFNSVDEISQYGLNTLDEVEWMIDTIETEVKSIERMVDSDIYTLREKKDFIFNFNSNASYSYDKQMFCQRQWGLREVANANDLRTEHMGIRHLEAAKKGQEARQAETAERIINQNWQEMYSSYGRQLAKIVQEKIDEKNDITNPERKEEPEKEEENDKNIIATAGNDSKENTEDEQI